MGLHHSTHPTDPLAATTWVLAVFNRLHNVPSSLAVALVEALLELGPRGVGFRVRAATAVVVLEIVQPPPAVGGRILELMLVGAWPVLAGAGASRGVHPELKPLAVGIVCERLDPGWESYWIRLDRPVRIPLDLPAVVDVHVFVPLSLIHISEPTRLLSISYAVFCLKKKKKTKVTKSVVIVTTVELSLIHISYSTDPYS
eukprot:TRINITY_DN4221_c0_g2_i14.p1 TRINITY_DN4221_c0_g2~~TRINITY_DN4221_c0_g2_i14.p1  ORF type:complete len:200 (+),score=12.54 TRINITY_DN4221_c0_g2_i14:81-680(+)